MFRKLASVPHHWRKCSSSNGSDLCGFRLRLIRIKAFHYDFGLFLCAIWGWPMTSCCWLRSIVVCDCQAWPKSPSASVYGGGVECSVLRTSLRDWRFIPISWSFERVGFTYCYSNYLSKPSFLTTLACTSSLFFSSAKSDFNFLRFLHFPSSLESRAWRLWRSWQEPSAWSCTYPDLSSSQTGLPC